MKGLLNVKFIFNLIGWISLLIAAVIFVDVAFDQITSTAIVLSGSSGAFLIVSILSFLISSILNHVYQRKQLTMSSDNKEKQ